MNKMIIIFLLVTIYSAHGMHPRKIVKTKEKTKTKHNTMTYHGCTCIKCGFASLITTSSFGMFYVMQRRKKEKIS